MNKNLPNEIINIILSYRGLHPILTNKIIDKPYIKDFKTIIHDYNQIYMLHFSNSEYEFYKNILRNNKVIRDYINT